MSRTENTTRLNDGYDYPGRWDYSRAPILDLRADKIVTEATKFFEFGPDNGRITGRLTPLDALGLYVVDFVRDDGTRIRGRPTVDVYDVTEGPQKNIAMGGEADTEYFYYLSPLRDYEVRYNSSVVQEITFQRRQMIQTEGLLRTPDV